MSKSFHHNPPNSVTFSSLAGKQLPKKVFCIAEQTITYGELQQKLSKLTTLFHTAGIRQGNRVILATDHDGMMSEIFLALLLNGITVVVLDPDSAPQEAKNLIESSKADGIIIDKSLSTRWDVFGAVEADTFRLLIQNGSSKPSKLIDRLLKKKGSSDNSTYPAILTSLDMTSPPETVPEHLTAYIIFTSGTTSQPKGVQISNRALYDHLTTLSQHLQYDESTRILNILPLSHVDGLIQGPVVAFFNGASIIRPYRFSHQTILPILDCIYRYRITHLVVVPTILAIINRLEDDISDYFNCEDFRFSISAASFLEPALWNEMERRTAHLIVNLYGLTETVTGSLFCGPDSSTRKVGALGKPVDCQVRIIGEDGNPVQPGDSGELQIRGSHVMSGYLNMPDVTAKVLQNCWFHTGDLVREDEEGFFHYVGRLKSLIIRGGLNIVPEEVEQILKRHPEVEECAVVGVSDDQLGEVPVAYIIPQANCSPTEAEIVNWVRSLLSSYKVPVEIRFGTHLPKGRSGKALTAEIQALFHSQEKSIPLQDKAEMVKQVAADIFKVPVTSLSSHSSPDNTPGWDSLGHMTFIAALEKSFGLGFTTREIITIDTLHKAVLAIEDKSRNDASQE